eukprot:TRINITY_DN2931_c0_g1_i4.p2 TRINITY_DN2931_c0_g1~~TRINITY_DN2931_c0_g1_i4.p2  ORF type:complete len:108 (+),score=1.68 TRINITY_DN2931_c0_g1_i4:688-1011(+)
MSESYVCTCEQSTSTSTNVCIWIVFGLQILALGIKFIGKLVTKFSKNPLDDTEATVNKLLVGKKTELSSVTSDTTTPTTENLFDVEAASATLVSLAEILKNLKLVKN